MIATTGGRHLTGSTMMGSIDRLLRSVAVIFNELFCQLLASR
jgi:hypothetical protein